jgi:pyruvate dehydrogenase E2 component (dihydrolipoamide acetyltransferase)
MAIEVLVPPLGQTVDTVTLVTWYKQEGDTVAKDEPLFSIETDKATLDVEAPASGVLRQVRAMPGDAVKVLSAIALIVAPDEAWEADQPPSESHAASRDIPLPAPEPGESSKDGADREHRIFISPRARRLAEEHGVPFTDLRATGPQGAIIERDVQAYLEAHKTPAVTPVARRMAEEAGLDWRSLSGSGPGGRITREDVARALEVRATAIASVGPAAKSINEVREAIPLHSVRAVVAERMLRSAIGTARVTLTTEADATALVGLRHQLVQDGVNLSYNDLFLYILGRTLRDHPQLNASLEGETIKLWRRIHIGLAVDTDRGLLVPVVRDVDGKGLRQLAQDVAVLVERARSGQCTPDELSGGTFTLTNLGMFGIDAFTPIINLPECAILGVGRIKRQPVMLEDRVVGRHMVWLSLTFDHRLVDGGPAARFLQRVVQYVERPHLLMA